MLEHQGAEWKEIWKDEYLKWICGYANAQGGILIIGKDDNGDIAGIRNAKKLLEDIPNKIVSTMNIIADVNLIEENGLEYIEIIVDSYPFPVNYRGKYYYRSGSTMQEIKGIELLKFLYEKQGRTWDNVPIPGETADSLSKEALQEFRKKSVYKKRLSKIAAEVNDKLLLENLKLFERENLIRAAILMFHPDPEKWVTGAYIKIGYFGESNSDLRYQDEIHGPLILQADKTVELIYTKYMKALIDYEGLQRTETYMFPMEGFREILLNAINHKDYSTGIPIQISIYEDKIYVWNDGKWPENLPVDKIYEKHSSIPYNPKIADVFYKAGEIESWGRGFDKIMEVCKAEKAPYPVIDANARGVMVLCKPCDQYNRLLKDRREKEFLPNVRLEKLSQEEQERMAPILKYLDDNSIITNAIGRDLLGKSVATTKRYLNRLCEIGILEQKGAGRSSYYERK
ncbi:MAG: ATP-dependent DNA helicase RecG [Ruminococcus sp.]|nr:ATP-dependent DNA helicase RecG [Ruminococcus sp.]